MPDLALGCSSFGLAFPDLALGGDNLGLSSPNSVSGEGCLSSSFSDLSLLVVVCNNEGVLSGG
ncbi:MAG: hypothetical protein LBF22_06995 [Deltaproteobacteria bacterium]|nr:hypothetical protein [Deltaproteobacteria bacterium]